MSPAGDHGVCTPEHKVEPLPAKVPIGSGLSWAVVVAAFLSRSVARLMDGATTEIQDSSALFGFIESKKWTRDAAEAVIVEASIAPCP